MTRAWLRLAPAIVLGTWLAGCASIPPPIISPQEEYEPELVQVPTPLVEYPPIEPVEPPEVMLAPAPAAEPSPAPATTTTITTSAVPAAPAAPETVASAAPSLVAAPSAAVPAPASAPVAAARR